LVLEHGSAVDRFWSLYQGLKPWVTRSARADEVLVVQVRAEASDFIRFNHGRVRQAGHVERVQLLVRLIDTSRRVSSQAVITVSPPATNTAVLDEALAKLRETNAVMPADPWLSWHPQAWTLEQRHETSAVPSEQAMRVIARACADADLVGFLMQGPMVFAVLSSVGIALWHSASRYSFEASVYAPAPADADKAVKFHVAGDTFDAQAAGLAIEAARQQARVLMRPAIELAPGDYRVWLAPAACAELLGMLSWGGFSASAIKTGQSPLNALEQGQVAFAPAVHLAEALGEARAPLFDGDGVPRARAIELVKAGRLVNTLISSRSAIEFDLKANGAASHEAPEVGVMQPGDLPAGKALDALHTGISISNLWYLNFSDRQRCAITGMTRFASLWVENGVAVAPIKPMRFDDSLFELLGPQLEAIESQSHWLPDTDSYDWRSWGAVRAPGILIRKMRFAL
jgi:predicted Zn-dependent protease